MGSVEGYREILKSSLEERHANGMVILKYFERSIERGLGSLDK
jgi:hypothetical protein